MAKLKLTKKKAKIATKKRLKKARAKAAKKTIRQNKELTQVRKQVNAYKETAAARVAIRKRFGSATAKTVGKFASVVINKFPAKVTASNVTQAKKAIQELKAIRSYNQIEKTDLSYKGKRALVIGRKIYIYSESKFKALYDRMLEETQHKINRIVDDYDEDEIEQRGLKETLDNLKNDLSEKPSVRKLQKYAEAHPSVSKELGEHLGEVSYDIRHAVERSLKKYTSKNTYGAASQLYNKGLISEEQEAGISKRYNEIKNIYKDKPITATTYGANYLRKVLVGINTLGVRDTLTKSGKLTQLANQSIWIPGVEKETPILKSMRKFRK